MTKRGKFPLQHVLTSDGMAGWVMPTHFKMPVTGGRIATPEVAVPLPAAGDEVVACPEEAILALSWAAL